LLLGGNPLQLTFLSMSLFYLNASLVVSFEFLTRLCFNLGGLVFYLDQACFHMHGDIILR
jgi:hypothetical protein